MLKINIYYYERIGHGYFPEAFGIIYINCEKSIGYLLEKQTVENFMTPFVTNMVFQRIGLSWFIQSNKK